jgi:hypothetical protein
MARRSRIRHLSECRPGHGGNGRRCAIQLDDFHGDGLRSAVHEVDRARVHDLPDDESTR